MPRDSETHHFTARHEYRPWRGIGLITRWQELHLVYEGEEADALRSLQNVFTEQYADTAWVITRRRGE